MVLTAWLAAATASAGSPEEMRPVTAADSVLVVAPHPDDESLCCGGLIHMARAAGAQVSIVWITSGDAFRWDVMVLNHSLVPHSAAFRALAEIREAEARVAASRLGVGAASIYFLGYPDRGVSPLLANAYEAATPWRSPYTGAQSVIYPEALDPGARYDGASLERDFETVLDRTHPTRVLAPCPQDTHPDHRGAGLLAQRALAARGQLDALRCWIVHGGYGWPHGGFEPKKPLDVAPSGAGLHWEQLRLDDAAIAAKLQAIEAHQSQVRVMENVMRRYVHSTELYAPVARSLPK
jgi:LmbE family N-acetylglucosaminyl deacetylase